MADTFISYRREDSAGYAGRLREALERRLGEARVFRDVDTLLPGQDFVDAIESRLAACHVMLVVIGREWVDARLPSGTRRLDDPYDFVRLEVAAGLARHGVLVIPVLVEHAAMPSAADLPDNIRPLARRHAVSVRDETWDADVDRLAAVIRRIPSHDRRSWAPPWLQMALRPATVAMVSAAAILVVAAAVWLSGPRPADPASEAPATGAAPASSGAAYTIDVPRMAEAAFGDLIMTLVSGNVLPRGDGQQLRLRMRVSNGSPYPMNFWDAGFRLALGSETLAPTSELNEIVPGNSMRYGIVTFSLPARAESPVLKVIQGTTTADIPVNLAPTGRPPVDEQATIEDSLSQAIGRRLITEPSPLIETKEVAATVLSATSRRFVNALRISLSVRIENRGPYPFYGGNLLVRVEAGGEVVAPLAPPDAMIDAASTGSTSMTFDLLPRSSRAVVVATLGTESGRIALDLDTGP